MKTLLGMLVCSGVLYALYLALLDRRVPFRWCRGYLLGAAVAAALIPLLRIPVWPGPVLTGVPQIAVGAVEATFEIVGDAPGQLGEWLFWSIYAVGCAAVAGTTVRQLLQVRRLSRGAEAAVCGEYRLVRTLQPVEACSFFRTIYIRHDTPDEELPVIVQHELSHIRHRHSAERSCMEVLKALLWWNPFVWLLAGRLREVEEFEADRDVLRSGCDPQRYMQLILKQLLGYSPDITNGLRNSLTKKRFLMMTTNHPHRYVLLRLAGALPALFGLLCAFSFTTRAAVRTAPDNEPEPPQTYTVTELPAAGEAFPAVLTIKSDEEPVLRAEQMPTYRGGDLQAFRQWSQLQLRYPQEAVEQQLEGRVAVSFIIEKDGTLDNIRVLASPAEVLSREVVRILQKAERWEPGRNADGQPVRVKYTLPIDFRLPAPDETGNPLTEARETAEESGVRIDPMVVVAFPKQ